MKHLNDQKKKFLRLYYLRKDVPDNRALDFKEKLVPTNEDMTTFFEMFEKNKRKTIIFLHFLNTVKIIYQLGKT